MYDEYLERYDLDSFKDRLTTATTNNTSISSSSSQGMPASIFLFTNVPELRHRWSSVSVEAPYLRSAPFSSDAISLLTLQRSDKTSVVNLLVLEDVHMVRDRP